MMMDAIDFMKSHQSETPSKWREFAQYNRDNWQWLKYSYAIAILVRKRMAELGMTQKQLAEAMDCSQQHVSVLLNGRVNMTLETMAKLEAALQIDLLGHVLDFQSAISSSGFLNDPGLDPASQIEIKTKQVVSGYAPRKKKGPKKKQ